MLGIDEIARLEKERHVPDVMQAERNERALDDAVDREGERRPAVHRPVREALDPFADRRPDKAQHRAATMTANAVMIGTERLPAKKPR